MVEKSKVLAELLVLGSFLRGFEVSGCLFLFFWLNNGTGKQPKIQNCNL